MTVAATSNLALAFEAMRTLVANCATFQAWAGETTAAGAIDYIDLKRCRLGDDGMALPRCLITMGSSTESVGTGVGNGEFTVTFFGHNASPEMEDRALVFLNKVGAIVTEMKALGRTGGYLAVREIVIEPSQDASEQENEDIEAMTQACIVRWGLSGLSS